MKEQCKIHDKGFRHAMRYPSNYVEGISDSAINSYVNKLYGTEKSKLVEIISNNGNEFLLRWAAGLILGVIGDPRIRVLMPDMLEIPEATVNIGLDLKEVDEIVELYSNLGVERNWILKEAPRHSVQIDRFRLGKYPVTNREYVTFLKETQFNEIPTSWMFGEYPVTKDNHPVYSVSASAADAYVEWLSAKTRRRFRLPTEAEWEYAASGGNRREFPWGDEFLSDRANTIELGILQSTPVGIFPLGVSPFGCFDMAGNVEEYVAENYYPYTSAEIIDDDLFKINQGYRIARGGSFTRFKDLARCKRRHGYNGHALYLMGFRIAETIS